MCSKAGWNLQKLQFSREDQERNMKELAQGIDNLQLPGPLLGTFMDLSHSS